MTDTPPAVALLFDDTELGAQLRDALHERGARIVHEGGVASLNLERLREVDADVVVVNLDDGAEDALEPLYEVLEGDCPRVVFNDAQASRALVGWERARWARHLAVKVLAAGEIDPPRPEDARAIEVPAPASEPREPQASGAVEPALADGVTVVAAELDSPYAVGNAPGPRVAATAESDSRQHPAGAFAAEAELEPEFGAGLDAEIEAELEAEFGAELEAGPDPESEFDFDLDIDFPVLDELAFDRGSLRDSALDDASAPSHPVPAAESEDLAAELEALLAAGGLPGDENDFAGRGLRFPDDAELPPLYDGDFGAPEPRENPVTGAAARLADALAPKLAAVTFDTDHLQLSALDEAGVATEPAEAAQPVPPPAPPAVSAPEGWALLDDEAPPDPAMFGIEKISAAEFLAPEAEPVSPALEPTMNLELVSLEDAIAPQAYVPDHEMLLDELGSALSRIVLLGASVDGTDSLCQFLDALPQTTRLTFLLTQHLGEQSDAQMLERVAGHGPLPVRLADANRRAGMGEVLMVPAGQHVRLLRDGSIELLTSEAPEPSIDANLSMAANAFGRDALAIVFSGRGTDATAGAQAIHDRGGQVWVESPTGEHVADMVSGIFAERLVSFSGSPRELAAHLIEVFP